MRLAVYCDYSYRRDDGTLWAELPFARFLAGLAGHLERLTLVGSLDPKRAPWHRAVPAELDFVPLPYSSLANPAEPARALVTSLRRFWRLLPSVDGVWLLGPHPIAVAFALLAALRRRPVALGVRQDLELDRSSHLVLQCSWTEGLPQVLYEAFPQRVPVVGTDVYDVRAAAEGPALLVPPGDAEAAATALETLDRKQASGRPWNAQQRKAH